MTTVAVMGLASVAYADGADRARRAAPAAVAAPSWTGFYVGGSGGYTWQRDGVTYAGLDPGATTIVSNSIAVFGSTAPDPISIGINRGFWGIQAGYNWQTRQNALVGLEADFNWFRGGGTGTANFLFPGAGTGLPSNIQATQDVKWLATLRARVGWLPTNDWLLYGTAGLAVARFDESVALNSVAGANLTTTSGGTTWSVVCVAGPNCFVGSRSRTQVGWTAGAGTEYALTRNVSLKAEYLYVYLDASDGVQVVGQQTAAAAHLPMAFQANFSSKMHIVRGGLNYRFGGP